MLKQFKQYLSRSINTSFVKNRKKLNNREFWDLNRYNFWPYYFFMELIAYINAQCCSVYLETTYLTTLLDFKIYFLQFKINKFDVPINTLSKIYAHCKLL